MSGEGFQLECEGYGCVPAKWMFVGISAGRRGALLSKVPLTKDASGRIFQRCLRELGLSESDEFSLKPVLKDTYLTNLVKGRCLDEDGNNRMPTDEEVSYWTPRLVDEIRKVRPDNKDETMVVALGDFVWRRFGPVQRAFLLERRRIRTFPVKHPRWFCSQGGLKPDSPAFKTMVEEYRTRLPSRPWSRSTEKH